MRVRSIAVSAALAAAVIGTSLAAPFAAAPAFATTGPFSLVMDPADYYAYLAHPGILLHPLNGPAETQPFTW
jgi:hypothetical protein